MIEFQKPFPKCTKQRRKKKRSPPPNGCKNKATVDPGWKGCTNASGKRKICKCTHMNAHAAGFVRSAANSKCTNVPLNEYIECLYTETSLTDICKALIQDCMSVCVVLIQ